MTRDEIIASKRPCTTAPDATGMPCRCDYDCRNYWMQANGLGTGTGAPPFPAVPPGQEG